MHPADIKAHLEKAGFSQADIARQVLGRKGEYVSQAAVHHVIRGLSRSKTIARKIAEVTGLSVSQLWPGKYPELEALDRLAKSKSALAKAVSGPAAQLEQQLARPRAKQRRAA